MSIVFLVLLIMVFVAPSVLSLTPSGYNLMPTAHLIAFVASVVVFVWMGRTLRKRGPVKARVGLVIGAIGAALGALGSQWVMHTVPATDAFVAAVTVHGVPRAAAITLHNLHAVTSALLTAVMAAVFYGMVGLIATWWGSRQFSLIKPRRETTEP